MAWRVSMRRLESVTVTRLAGGYENAPSAQSSEGAGLGAAVGSGIGTAVGAGVGTEVGAGEGGSIDV